MSTSNNIPAQQTLECDVRLTKKAQAVATLPVGTPIRFTKDQAAPGLAIAHTATGTAVTEGGVTTHRMRG